MKWEYVAIGVLLAWAISATVIATTYYSQYSYYYNNYGKVIYIDVGINYGNGTLVWYNSVKVLSYMTVYDALLLVADHVSASHGAYGVYVTEINGIMETANDSWLYAINRNDSSVKAWYSVNGWYYPGVAADQLHLKDGDKVVWVYLNWRIYFPPPDPTTTENIR